LLPGWCSYNQNHKNYAHSENLAIDGRIMLKWRASKIRLSAIPIQVTQVRTVGSSENITDPSSSIKGEKFLDMLKD
jgi:hypothetical protein